MKVYIYIAVSESSGLEAGARMSGADHAILDLGEDELQFTNNDYKTQVWKCALVDKCSCGHKAANTGDTPGQKLTMKFLNITVHCTLILHLLKSCKL